MRDDLVDRQHRVRRRHDQVLEADADRRRGAVLDRLVAQMRSTFSSIFASSTTS